MRSALGNLPRRRVTPSWQPFSISWGLAWASSDAQLGFLTLPLPLFLNLASSPPPGARQVKGCRAVLARADLKKIPSIISASSRQNRVDCRSTVALMCCPALMLLGPGDGVVRYPISLLWSVLSSRFVTGPRRRGPLSSFVCSRFNVAYGPGMSRPWHLSRFPPLFRRPHNRHDSRLACRCQSQIASLVGWLPPMPPATTTLLLNLASWCWPYQSSVT